MTGQSLWLIQQKKQYTVLTFHSQPVEHLFDFTFIATHMQCNVHITLKQTSKYIFPLEKMEVGRENNKTMYVHF